ncbi:GGDEF domain-containing protein [Paenibacillus sp. MMS20-IR301]|uniref:GGDEF domain-containing protein n=1 Tax=Paenibacillus sp. MMS20-IR301 TaxID=2895946 RepID=UPI0028EF5FFB|nr:GGDEF domain-containing protein [Paenibacillus sp. MMS20-IR301]WNS43581.1 GGDEF domain-containing protein [Paenibacillus sp. MMS20-IR301]
MDVQLDIETLLYLFILGNLFSALLITFYRYHFSKDTGSILFIISKWIQVVYWSSILLWDCIPQTAAIPLSNALILAGGGLEITSLLKLMGMLDRKAKLYYSGLAAGSILSFAIIILFFNHANLRVASTSLWVLLFVIYPGYRLKTAKGRTPLQNILGSIFYSVAAVMLLRTFVALFVEPGMGPLTANPAQYLYYMGMFIMLAGGIAAFVMLSNEHSYEKLKRIATYDSLTGILGRRAFLLEAELKLALAARKQECCSLLLLDLDHFKKVNDTYGHDNGDKVLQDFALTIEGALDNGDLFGRVGGEEFAIMLCGQDVQSSSLKAEELREAVKAASVHGLACLYTVSIGIITVLPDQQTGLSTLFKLSDRALYQAKQEGRDRVVRAG